MMQTADPKTEFLEEVDHLYQDINDWLEGAPVTFRTHDVQIQEEQFGQYKAPTLDLTEQGNVKTIAELVPVGASISGARGRVDLKGRYASEILSLLEAGGPSISISIGTTSNPREEQRSHKLYKGVKEAGWYWIESRSLGRAHRLTSEVFFALLNRVSNYGSGK